MIRRRECQRSIEDITRLEKEQATFYGLHNRKSFKEVTKKFKYIIVKPITKETLRVVAYGDDEEKSFAKVRQNPDCALVIDGEFII